MASEQRDRRRSKRKWLWIGCVVGVLATLLFVEARTSWLQARVFSAWASGITYEVEAGPETRPWEGSAGPFDLRRGYTRLGEILPVMEARGYAVDSQARVSRGFRRSLEFGLYPVYREKSRAGLALRDRRGEILYESRYPRRVYADFGSIPGPIVQTLLFLENRELLESGLPNRNPVVEWDRLGRSVAGLLARKLGAEGARAGGSTLATQIEKYKHSPGGFTVDPREKLRQMGTATARAYRGGRETRAERERIVVDYLNSVPLAAVPGYGEVLGLRDALEVWFGLDPARVDGLLTTADATTDSAGIAYRSVLALLLSQRRPSYYLASDAGQASLDALVNVHLRLLERGGIVDPALLTAAGRASLSFPSVRQPSPQPSFADRKAANALRNRLLALMGTDRLYELDRMDLEARSTIDGTAQDSVTHILQRLASPEYVRSSGLVAPRLLGSGDPSKVVYSVLLYEIGEGTNELRVQADNFPGPFDVNEASRLELGSTAKLRTLVTYLEVVERLYGELAALDESARSASTDTLDDPLTRWAVTRLGARPAMSVRELLDASMERRYSGSPAERFFTGGGQHVFQNFDRTYDGSSLTVRDAFHNSVNLVFVRMMRDVERYYRARLPAVRAGLLDDPGSAERQAYLARFADREGRQFLGRFWNRYGELAPDEIVDALLSGRRLTPRRLAWTFRAVRPDASPEEFSGVLRERSPDSQISDRTAADLYRMADVANLSLADQGYLAGIHPLELWIVRYRLENAAATRQEAMEASAEVRQEVYEWLFGPRRRRAQERSLSIMLEIESFLEIQRAWSRVGYPFENIVASYGTSIGSSGDRPEALAQLVGIILNGGVSLPPVRLTSLTLGVGTPYETHWSLRPRAPEVVMSEHVAAVARQALAGVVAGGTARTVRDAFVTPDGDALLVGGKTGTGNNQYKVFGGRGTLLRTRTINRTATFVFYIGSRHFGVITAHVDGEGAAGYAFTSALPLAVLRLVAPALMPLVRDAEVTDTARPIAR